MRSRRISQWPAVGCSVFQPGCRVNPSRWLARSSSRRNAEGPDCGVVACADTCSDKAGGCDRSHRQLLDPSNEMSKERRSPMKPLHGVILLALGLMVGAAVGYRSAYQAPSLAGSILAIPAAAQSSDRKILYYRDPSGAPYWSADPKKDANGRDYLPVYDDEEPAFGPGGELQKPTRQASGPRKILYYRNPMGLPDVSPKAKKDSMGMDYIPVYEGEDDDGSSIKISPGRLQRIGVKSEAAQQRIISEPIRAPGTIQLDERRIAVISMRSETFIEKVEDVTTGSEVRKGEPLMQIYSPAIVSAAADFVATLGMRTDAGLRGGRQRLLNLAVPESFLKEIERTRQV